MPIFRVKSVKIYMNMFVGFMTNMRYVHEALAKIYDIRRGGGRYMAYMPIYR